MFKFKLMLVCAGVFLLASCQSQNSIESRNIATLHRYWNELLNGKDISKAHEIIAPDFTLYINRKPTEPRGVEIFIQMAKIHDHEGALSQNQFFEDEIVAAENTIASRWRGTALHDREVSGYKPIPNDHEIAWQGMCFYHFNEKGLMTDGHVVTNLWELFESRERANKPVDIRARNIATLHRYFKELLNFGDHSKHHEIITPDFTLYYDGEPDTAKGIEIFKSMKQDGERCFSKIEFGEDEAMAKGNMVASRWHTIAVHDRDELLGYKPDGKEMRWCGMSFYHFNEDGLMTHGHVVNNVIEAFEARERAAQQASAE